MRYILIFLLLLSEFIYAQPAGLYRVDSTRLTDIRERLVQLAIQGPTYEMADHATQAAASQITIAKSAYLGLFSAQGNLNEFTVRNAFSSGNNNQYAQIYYPRYNFGLNVPFDIFTRTRNTVKIAKDNYSITLAEKNEKFREIKADVLTKYENYLLAKQLVEFQSKLTQNEYSQFKRAESDFADNLIKLDDLEKAQKSYITEQVKSLSMQRDLNLSKIEIEKVIGVKIEDVEKGLK